MTETSLYHPRNRLLLHTSSWLMNYNSGKISHKATIWTRVTKICVLYDKRAGTFEEYFRWLNTDFFLYILFKLIITFPPESVFTLHQNMPFYFLKVPAFSWYPLQCDICRCHRRQQGTLVSKDALLVFIHSGASGHQTELRMVYTALHHCPQSMNLYSDSQYAFLTVSIKKQYGLLHQVPLFMVYYN